VVKGGKKFKAAEKLRALKLLNKAVMASDSNQPFLQYVQKKVLKRLTILAFYCPKGQKYDDAQGLMTRGELIFIQDEPDTTSASHFLIVLLDCIEKWAYKHKYNQSTGQESEFVRSYRELSQAKVVFPSKAKK
jgi:hypothetical protein